MIGSVKGRIIDRGPNTLVVETASGVGYEMFVPSSAAGDSGEAFFWVHTQVREDQLTLFGFLEKDELALFRKLISVSGIGPKVALAIISAAPTEKIKHSIMSGDPNLLASVSGVGRKTAEKAIVELKNKLGPVVMGTGGTFGENDEVQAALCSLGFTQKEAAEAVLKLSDEAKTVNEKIKMALKMVGK
jgi:Holliday junction DNA helicase RuvA